MRVVEAEDSAAATLAGCILPEGEKEERAESLVWTPIGGDGIWTGVAPEGRRSVLVLARRSATTPPSFIPQAVVPVDLAWLRSQGEVRLPAPASPTLRVRDERVQRDATAPDSAAVLAGPDGVLGLVHEFASRGREGRVREPTSRAVRRGGVPAGTVEASDGDCPWAGAGVGGSTSVGPSRHQGSSGERAPLLRTS